MIIFLFLRHRKKLSLFIIFCFAFLSVIIPLIFSITIFPIYQSRYLYFSAIFFLSFVGILIAALPTKGKIVFTILIISLYFFAYDYSIDVRKSSRTSSNLSSLIKDQKKEGDIVVLSGIYGFFEYSYYLGGVRLFEKNENVRSKKGEYSLVWDNDSNFINYSQLKAENGSVWLIGRSKNNGLVKSEIKHLFTEESLLNTQKRHEPELILLTR
jgi:hypothetical protein